jgi:hypothetical protein
MNYMKKFRIRVILPALLLVAMAMVPIASAYQASSYGTNYGYIGGEALDTSAAASFATDALGYMGYSSTHAANNPTTAFNRLINDNVFFFDGHGAAGQISFASGSSLYATGSISPRISDLTYSQANDVALAVYMACNTANTGSYGNLLVTSVSSKGMDTAVGWTQSINSAQSGIWSDYFWYRLGQGYDVETATYLADAEVQSEFGYFNQGGMNYHNIVGNEYMVIDPARAGY